MTCIMMTALTSSNLQAQHLTEKDITGIINEMAQNPRRVSHVMWLEDSSRLDYYIGSAPERCLDDLEDVINFAERGHLDNARIIQLEQQIYAKPGKKKCEEALQKYFKNPDAARTTFQCAHEAEALYQRLVREVTPLIEAKKNQTFTAPKGELLQFSFRQGGGMRHVPATHVCLKKGKDGSYTAELDTYSFTQYDTIAITQAQADTVRQMLIDGEVYKMPRYYDSPMMVLDAPRSSVSVTFSDASYSCSDFPPSDWGGKNIWEAYRYLKALQPKREMTEEERRMFY